MRKENALIGYAFCKKARARSGRSVGDGAGDLSVCKLREHYNQPIFGGRMNSEKSDDARLPAAPLCPERSHLISQGALGRKG